jgi:Ca2+-binding RTX toxin-like protein
VDQAGDVVTEAASAGTDTVQSAITYTLGSNLENLTLTGTSAINGTGNTLNNVLTGNSAANVLNGGTGSDSMAGGTGNDTYVVDNTGDTVTENANAGTDLVQSSITQTLAANVEHLTLTGTSAINGTGNTLDNILIGNSATNTLTGGAGTDTLDGGLGSDIMIGGTGNDTYVVNSTSDVVTENANEGTDTVQSSVTWTLGSNLEQVTLTGTSAINGTGNTLNNVLTGNVANNVLTGLGGNDTYLYSRGGGQDMVVDSAGTSDTLGFGAMITPLDLVLSRQVNDLRLAMHGTTDQVTIQNWYTSPTTNQVETFQAGTGQLLLSTQVEQLIQAMAAFTQQSGLTWDQAIEQRPQEVQAVLAASWQ